MPRLQQVVWNLLSNAIKFTPKGGAVRVSLARVGSHLELSVFDTGSGIQPEFLPFVFDRFRQQESSISRTQPGLGLGLAIVRHLTEMHGGTVQVTSPGPGLGATFTIKLPVSAPIPTPDLARVRPAARPTPAPAQPANLGGRRVLVVDDDVDTRELLAALLEGYRAEVTMAGGVAEALALLGEGVPDFLLTDLGMPGQDGYALIAKLRESPDPAWRRVPAVAITAYTREEDRANVLRAGFDAHVAKPIEPAHLLDLMLNLNSRPE
jgi:CheY-like chemotaxis protein